MSTGQRTAVTTCSSLVVVEAAPRQTEVSSLLTAQHDGGETDVSEGSRQPPAGSPAERSLHGGQTEKPGDLGVPGVARVAPVVGGEGAQLLQRPPVLLLQQLHQAGEGAPGELRV